MKDTIFSTGRQSLKSSSIFHAFLNKIIFQRNGKGADTLLSFFYSSQRNHLPLFPTKTSISAHSKKMQAKIQLILFVWQTVKICIFLT
jgi:hypothetical protein